MAMRVYPGERAVMAVLVVTQGPGTGATFSVESDRIVLGRQNDCDLHEVFAGHASVSRRHACIFRSAGRHFVQDLGSRNGTLLNGYPLRERTPLSSGDRLLIGETMLEFREKADDVGGRTDDRPLDPLSSVYFAPEEEDSHVSSVMTVPRPSQPDALLSRNPKLQLRALVRLLENLGKSLDTDDILDELLLGLFDVFPGAERGFVGLRDANRGEVVPRVVRYRRPPGDEAIRVSRTLIQRAIQSQEAILSADVRDDPRFQASQSISSHSIRSVMCVPILDRAGEVLGVLQVDSSAGRGQFNQQDLEVLASITPHAAMALSYARLHSDALRRQALERDLELARRVQRNLLPDRQPQLSGYEFFSFYEAAYAVGGDYYDYVPLPDGRLAIVVADVVGKGISAALLMAKLGGELKYLLCNESTPEAAMARMSESFNQDSRIDRFVTLATVIVDPRQHQSTIVNAGHPAPVLRNVAEGVREVGVEARGVPLGVLEGTQYQATQLELRPGDTIVMYTDGLSEAARDDNSLYGHERLFTEIGRGPEAVQDLGSRILQEINQFTGGNPQSDDMCLICFRRTDGTSS
jgi:serine phosphatase RsbU (regulator of sigma subunit)